MSEAPKPDPRLLEKLVCPVTRTKLRYDPDAGELISDAAGVARLGDRLAFGITVPSCDPFVAPLLYAIPVQLLAYHTAVLKDTDVDAGEGLGDSGDEADAVGRLRSIPDAGLLHGAGGFTPTDDFAHVVQAAP